MTDSAPNNSQKEDEIIDISSQSEGSESVIISEKNEGNSGNPPPEMKKKQPQEGRLSRRRRGSIFFHILLIVVGGVLLLSNLGFLSNSIGNTIISLWPVLFIAWGLDSIWRGEGLTGAVFLLGLGIVFLLGNFGYLTLNPWQVLMTIWPVLLIAIGFDIIISRHRNVWTSLIGLVLIGVLMVGALGLAGVGRAGGVAVPGEEVEFPLQGAKSAYVQILPSVGTVKLSSTAGSNILIEGTVPTSTDTQKTIQEYSNDGEVANLTLRSSGALIYSTSTTDSQSLWSLSLTPDVPVALKVGLGAGDSSLDLATAQLSGFEYDLGVGLTEITVPQSGNFEAEIDGAIGQITILVPAGMSVQLVLETGLTTQSLPESYVQSGERTYQSPDYENAENRVLLRVGLAIGQVTVLEK